MKHEKKSNGRSINIFGVIFSTLTVVAFSFLTIDKFKQNQETKVLPASSTIYYVSSVNGSDNNSGSSDKPFKTIKTAINKATPGTTIFVKKGTYKEKITITNKKGTAQSPISIVGESANLADYPVLDGGDTNFTSKKDLPVFTIKNSSWNNIERLKITNSTYSSIFLDASHYITIRRNNISYHSYGVLLRNKSSHLLMEYNEIYQKLPTGSTWTKLKDSKWEGGAVTSFGGAGMNVIRSNYFRDQFNAIYQYNSDRRGGYYDANIFIYSNRFENIVDDPYEPESYVFNNHFFNNTLINTHRVASFAPEGKQLLGPVYVYGNVYRIDKDPTLEAKKGRYNSAFKLELNKTYYKNGIHLFNNTIDVSNGNVNGYGLDILNRNLNNVYVYNNIIKNTKTAINSTNLQLKNSAINSNLSTGAFGHKQSQDFTNTNPQFSGSTLSVSSSSPAIDKSVPLSFQIGFTQKLVVGSKTPLGAYMVGQTKLRIFPEPVYTVPEGGEDKSFPANQPWPADSRGGVNPLSVFGDNL